ncbi:cysteine hydrolase [Paenibacillus lycopersici]|uniref:Cysteine hydrolase n=1 Tax=Paenibacillus lycopersici TaxID=2704462 RepID=A0A6C0G352_9BACL|nr:isochorismatase family cysteine hydrolase [Paenibacillus lycopersici]QHT63287.1 cysteine hydrolase [Paenibacillus lycopersici]
MSTNQTTALLVMDLQNGIVSRFPDKEAALEPFRKALETARQHNMQVIYVRVALREGYPEVSSRNKSFSAIASHGGMTETDEATQIYASVQPQPGEPLVTKRRFSAFTGSDLEVLLRGRQIDSLVLSGISTSGVVLSTLREAADKDYKLTVLADACLDGDPEVHRVLTEKVFPRQADVMTVDAWADTLRNR